MILPNTMSIIFYARGENCKTQWKSKGRRMELLANYEREGNLFIFFPSFYQTCVLLEKPRHTYLESFTLLWDFFSINLLIFTNREDIFPNKYNNNKQKKRAAISNGLHGQLKAQKKEKKERIKSKSE